MRAAVAGENSEVETLFCQLVMAIERYLSRFLLGETRNGAVGVEDIAQDMALNLWRRPQGQAFVLRQTLCLRRRQLPACLQKEAQRRALQLRGRPVTSLNLEDLDREGSRSVGDPSGETEVEELLAPLPPNLCALAGLLREGVPKHLIAQQLGVSERTLRNWLRELRVRLTQVGLFPDGVHQNKA